MNFDTANLLSVVFKIFFVTGSIMYFIFASIIIRQVQLMTSKVVDMFNTFIYLVSFLHLIFALLLVVSTLLL